MLQCKSLCAGYGPIVALHDISLDVRPREIVTLIGANGAGKSTMLKAIVGLVKLNGGEIHFEGRRVDGATPEALARQGIALVPEGRRVFPGLTVLENLEVGATARGSSRVDKRDDLDKVYALFPRLSERKSQLGWSLSGGEQQMLAIGRALMSRPKLLMLDEPSLGLAPLIVDEVFKTIEAISKLGTTILLVEQNARIALQIAERGYVVERGKVTIEGVSKALLADPEIIAAYLGA
jgi:branched-chain amino acid transport system ATP-binding protein